MELRARTRTATSTSPTPCAAPWPSNPFLKVFVANGYYDLATPFAATHYTFAHLQLDPELRSNVVACDYYEAGHMMYIDRKAQARLKKDVDEFIRANANVQ